MQTEFKQLCEEIQREFPANKTKLTLFPSGAAMLDVQIEFENYVLAYGLNVGIGIGRVSTATFGWEGYEKPFSTFEEGRDYLLSLLRKAGSK